jgi:adenylate cyclase
MNMMGDPAQEYFADGMTEDLITDLSKISGLCVIARNSTFTFKGQAVDVREAAQTLGARYVVEGSVRKLGERVRINTQLIDASTGAHIWAERYDGDLVQVFELQDEILAKIVSALQVNLKVGEKARLQSKTTSNLEAYDLFLKGRNAFYQLDRESFVAANELLKQAVSLDPGFAAAHAYLSQARMGLALFSSSEEREAGLREALEAAEAAVACDDSLGIAHAFLGWCQIWLLRYDDAMASFERAVGLAPNDAEVLGHYATALNYSGKPERAIEMFDLAMKLDPLLPPNLRFSRGVSLFLLNRLEEALDEFRTVAHVAPAFHGAHMWCAAVLTELGRAEEAEAVAAKLRDLPILYTDGMVRRIPFRDKSVRERMLGSLRKAGLLD